MKPETVSFEVMSSLDLLPIFCELSGTDPPVGVRLYGINFLSLFVGEKMVRSKPLFWCYFNALNEHRIGMRTGPWKQLAKLNGGYLPKLAKVQNGNVERIQSAKLTDFERYQISTDQTEAIKVSGEHSKELFKLRKQMEELYHELAMKSHVWTIR